MVAGNMIGKAGGSLAARRNMKKPPVLVVDDFASMRNVVIAVLKRAGFTEFIQAGNGVAALQSLAANPKIGFVISDWYMPEMDGLKLLQTIKADPKTQSIPVLMLTAEGLQQNVLSAVQSGAAAYLVKPFSPAALEERVRGLFPD